jgi:hypothetical protein
MTLPSGGSGWTARTPRRAPRTSESAAGDISARSMGGGEGAAVGAIGRAFQSSTYQLHLGRSRSLEPTKPPNVSHKHGSRQAEYVTREPGLPLVQFSAQSEPHLSLTLANNPTYSTESAHVKPSSMAKRDQVEMSSGRVEAPGHRRHEE